MFIRRFSQAARRRNLFGGKVANAASMPSGKGETASNPVDMIKKNDILMYSQKPINYIESIKRNGFHLASNILITSPNEKGNVVGTLLVDTESFEVDLANCYKLVNGFIVDFDEEQVLLVFGKLHPKPELLVVGLGKQLRVLAEANRRFLSGLGMQLEVSSLKNAAKMFDLLATERPGVVAAFLLPPNV